MRISIKFEYIIIIIIIIYILSTMLYFSVNIWHNNFSKLNINNFIPEKHKLKTYLLNDNNLSKLSYPYIIKPTICSGQNKNVSIINNANDLNNYKKNKNEIYIIQEYYKSKNEIGVLYEKIPHINDGNVISIVLKQNNSSHWKPLKCGNIKNNETTICHDLTKELELSNFVNIIKKISSKIPNFNAGRYDIGFENIEDLNQGNFKIYELNGVMGYDLRSNAYGDETIIDIFLKIYYVFKWIIIRYLIGLINILSLKVSPFFILNSYINSIYYCNECCDWEYLFQPTPC
jgi:hypothetical protein